MFLKKIIIFGLFVSAIFLCMQNCAYAPTDSSVTDLNNQENELFSFLDSASENIYDKNGSWGNTTFNYKMLLRDSYLRADVYLELYKKAKEPTYLARVNEVSDYLIRVQRKGGTGVFGIPADIFNPEFGTKINAILEQCPLCVREEIIFNFPNEKDIPELYYDHGYALYTLSHVYLVTKNERYLTAINEAAEWALDKPLSKNTNYLSAIAKGLAAAYQATNDVRFLSYALKLSTENIIPNQSQNGSWSDGHNDLLEYHGFIVSGLIAVFYQMDSSYTNYSEVKNSLDLAIQYMKEKNLVQNAGELQDTWPGTNLKAWVELENYRDLAADEQAAKSRCYELLKKDLEALKKHEHDYTFRKALYTYFSAGLIE